MERDLFRAGMRKLTGGVTIITSKDAEGIRCGMTATAVCSLTADPPAILACVNTQSSIARALQGAKLFAVNVLAAHQQHVAETFAGRHGLAREERFSDGQWIIGASGMPILADAACTFECEATEIKPFSTHLVMFGLVLHTRAANAELEPLVYGNGAFLQTLARPQFAASA